MRVSTKVFIYADTISDIILEFGVYSLIYLMHKYIGRNNRVQ